MCLLFHAHEKCKPHVTKELRKAIMKRSRLKNIANKSKLDSDLSLYKTQRNLVVKMNKELKQRFFETISTEDSKKSLWNICKPYFSNSGLEEKIVLLQKGTIVSDEEKVANIFNQFYRDITKNLNLTPWEPDEPVVEEDDPISTAINKYSSHPSIVEIKSRFQFEQEFHFEPIDCDQVRNYILRLDSKKKTSGSIPVSILQKSVDIVCPYITTLVNKCICECEFPNEQKLAVIRPVFKKDDCMDPSNYRPISLLPSTSKIFERVLYDQMCSYFDTIFSPLLCGFRKGYSSQHAILHVLYKWYQTLDSKGLVGTVLMDLSKAYDCLPHGLILAKLEAYGFDKYSLKLL